MKKGILVLGIILIFLNACSSAGNTAKITDLSISKLDSLSSVSYSLDVSIWQNGFLVQITGTGQHKTPDQSYLQLTSVGTNFEILSLSSNKIYMKDPAAGTWHSISSASLAQSGFAVDYFLQQVELLKGYSQPKMVGNEIIDGIACSHIQFKINPANLSEAFLHSILDGLKDLSALKISGELWVGKQDSQARRSVVVMEIGPDYRQTMTLDYLQFNSKLSFPSP